MLQEITTITGKDLIEWGHRPNKGFEQAINKANEALAEGMSIEDVRVMVEVFKPAPQLPLDEPDTKPLHINIEATDADEAKNVEQVTQSMRELLRTPTLTHGAIMPDACPTGPIGTIPVGGVVAAKNAIHPGMHSADICCSVMLSNFGDADPKTVLDAIHNVTHFGPGGRSNGKRFTMSLKLLDAFRENMFLNNPKIIRSAQEQMGTQGDGNHFAFVGKSRNTGDTCLVTHHGSRGPGAHLYKLGMNVAEKFRKGLSPQTLKTNAWIPFDTEEGAAYWEALQLMRKWTKANHSAIQQATLEVAKAQMKERFWNEHNFVFKRDDVFYHAKGATPAYEGFASDDTGLTLIPLNMSEPVLVARGLDADHGLGFSPHGAGRNFSRTEHRRRNEDITPEEMMARETSGLDIRFYSGTPDMSELPSAYKNADSVAKQIESRGLAKIEDYIDPYGCIMGGVFPAPWLERKKNKGVRR